MRTLLSLFLAALTWCALGLPMQAAAQQEAQQDAQQKAQPNLRGRVEGQVLGHAEAGLPVVLLQFRLNAKGEPEGGPIARSETKAGGLYVFGDVPVDSRSVYRLGTRIGGRLIGSDPFTFPRGETLVRFDLRVPELKGDAGVLKGRELMWVTEPRGGQLLITEVLHLENPTQDLVDLGRAPLELPLGEEARDFEMLRLDLEEGHQERLGPKLLVSGRVPPGVSAIAFRYRVPAPLGAVSTSRRYAFPIAGWRILSPDGVVRAEGEGLAPGDPETFEKVTYSTWSRADLAAGTALAVRLTGVPLNQWVLLPPVAGFALVMAGVVIWFLRRRLPHRDSL